MLLPVFWAVYFNQYSGSEFWSVARRKGKLTLVRFRSILLWSESASLDWLRWKLCFSACIPTHEHSLGLQEIRGQEAFEYWVSGSLRETVPMTLTSKLLLRCVLAHRSLDICVGYQREIRSRTARLGLG